MGFIETYGLAACIAAADAAVKSANVTLVGYEYAKGDGLCTVKVSGNVGACKAAIAAGKRAAELVNGTHKGTKSVLLKARPADGIMDSMVENAQTVGGEIALATGVRPKGESRMPVLVKNWKPKTDNIEAAPETPVVETKVEEPVVEQSSEDAPEEAPEESEQAPVEAPAEESPVVAPEAEEVPVVEETPEAPEAEVVAPEEEAPVVAPEAEIAPEATEEVKEEAVKPAEDTPKKSTSTGKRRGSRKKKNTDK